ncbi:MAG: 23S rRNA (adenine(2503)-C(2))-methyltransferase RlmN [Verrucomicrobiota bacterium]|nr:23S rRNA (adenine(2503)-C(2))-methyltransferase RlmN [Verrucomicrobiota bacterium]
MTARAKTAIKAIPREELEARLASLGEPAFRAKQLLDWIFRRRVSSFSEMTNLPAPLREKLDAEFSLGALQMMRKLGSNDTTQKFLFRLEDGSLIESVLIPASLSLYGDRSDRLTICVSTQVGCAFGCKFCASGLDGFSRNLEPDEIIDQILEVEKLSAAKINNIVFMGMGEPLANFTNLMRAIAVINSPWGINIGARHITLSTSGLAPRIRDLADQPLQIRLAVSLHGATDAVREQIMPINRKYNVETLMEACVYFQERKKQRITFEYILIEGINDTAVQAIALATHARRLNAKVNLIPYNHVEGLPWKKPSLRRQEFFLAALVGRGVVATIRREKGEDIDAACGQLRLQTQRDLDKIVPAEHDKSFAEKPITR